MDWLEVSVKYRHLFVNTVGSETQLLRQGYVVKSNSAPTLK